MLESRGYTVTSAVGYVDAIAKCANADYDLLIIGHSIPLTDKESLIREANQYSKCPILALLRNDEPKLAAATESVSAADSRLLLEVVARLLAGA